MTDPHPHDWRYHPQQVVKPGPSSLTETDNYLLVCAGCGENRYEVYDARGRWLEPVPIDADVSCWPRWE